LHAPREHGRRWPGESRCGALSWAQGRAGDGMGHQEASPRTSAALLRPPTVHRESHSRTSGEQPRMDGDSPFGADEQEQMVAMAQMRSFRASEKGGVVHRGTVLQQTETNTGTFKAFQGRAERGRQMGHRPGQIPAATSSGAMSRHPSNKHKHPPPGHQRQAPPRDASSTRKRRPAQPRRCNRIVRRQTTPARPRPFRRPQADRPRGDGQQLPGRCPGLHSRHHDGAGQSQVAARGGSPRTAHGWGRHAEQAAQQQRYYTRSANVNPPGVRAKAAPATASSSAIQFGKRTGQAPRPGAAFSSSARIPAACVRGPRRDRTIDGRRVPPRSRVTRPWSCRRVRIVSTVAVCYAGSPCNCHVRTLKHRPRPAGPKGREHLRLQLFNARPSAYAR